MPYLTPRADDPHGDYLRLVDAAVEGDDTFERKREVIDEYGWRHFGDIYGDHEAVFHKESGAGAEPLTSHYNNQYDPVAGLGYQFLRSGDHRWRRLMRELAAHVIDIDVYHTDRDKSAYNHGLFWHTFHYVDADTGTHRSYPKAAEGVRRRPGRRTQLRDRADASPLPHRRPPGPGNGDRPGPVGDRHGRRPQDGVPLAGRRTYRRWPAPAGRRRITAPAAAPPTRSWPCWTAIG